MKKIYALLLIFVMCLSFCACESTEDEIQDALQGSWVAEWTVFATTNRVDYIFKGNTYTTTGVSVFTPYKETGTFEIKDSAIHLIPDDGSDENDLEFSYNKKTGELILWYTDDVQFVKTK